MQSRRPSFVLDELFLCPGVIWWDFPKTRWSVIPREARASTYQIPALVLVTDTQAAGRPGGSGGNLVTFSWLIRGVRFPERSEVFS